MCGCVCVCAWLLYRVWVLAMSRFAVTHRRQGRCVRSNQQVDDVP